MFYSYTSRKILSNYLCYKFFPKAGNSLNLITHLISIKESNSVSRKVQVLDDYSKIRFGVSPTITIAGQEELKVSFSLKEGRTT